MLLARTPSLVSYLPMPIDIAAHRWRPRPRLHVRVHVLLRPGDASVGDGEGRAGRLTPFSWGGRRGIRDGNGAFHVLVLGGDDVNTPGTKHTGVYYY